MSLSAATKRKPLNCEVIYMILTHSSHFCLWITDSLNLWISLKMYQMQQRLSIYVCVFINSSHRLQSKESFMWSQEKRKVWTHSSFHVSVFLLLCTLWTQTEDIRYTKQDIWNYKEDQSKHVLYFRCLKPGWYHVSHQWWPTYTTRTLCCFCSVINIENDLILYPFAPFQSPVYSACADRVKR